MGTHDWFPSTDQIARVLARHRHEAEAWPRGVTPIAPDQEPVRVATQQSAPQRWTALELQIVCLLLREPRISVGEVHDFFGLNLAMSTILIEYARSQRDHLAGRGVRSARRSRPRTVVRR